MEKNLSKLIEKSISCILLAAGESRRMGPHNKLLLDIAGQTLVHRTAEELMKYPFQEIIAVTGHESDLVKKEIDFQKIRIIYNENHKIGMHSSIRAGLNALQKSVEGFMVCLSDQPLFHWGLLQLLANRFLQGSGPRIVFPTLKALKSQKGHPVFISYHFIEEILYEPDGDYGCNYLFKRHPDALQPVAVDDQSILVDVDTPEQYQALIRAL